MLLFADSPYYSSECDTCVGGPNSPSITGCTDQPVVTGGKYCGLLTNPCTRDNIMQRNLYFACPDSETHYLQCNLWGHAYIRSCGQNEVRCENVSGGRGWRWGMKWVVMA